VGILSPPDDAELYQHEAHMRGDIFIGPQDNLNLETMEVCWEVNSRFLGEKSAGCWPALPPRSWPNITVKLPNRGGYDASLRLVQFGETVSEAHSTFRYGIHPACREALVGRNLVQPTYYEALENRGTRAPQRSEASPDDEKDSYVNFELAPLCYDSWPDRMAGSQFIEGTLSVTSASRGMFGVDYSMQQFGHGDRILLDFVLDKHRAAIANITELGTFGGVTALYLGMAALLRGGYLDTFDIVDDRSETIKSTWLTNMIFHLGNANKAASSPPAIAESNGLGSTGGGRSSVARATPTSTGKAAVESIRKAGLVLIDHADRLEFVRKFAAPNLQPGGVILVHDFPPEYTTEEMWEEALRPFGIVRRYREIQSAYSSCLAVFTHQPNERL